MALKLLEMRQDIGDLCVMRGISKHSPGPTGDIFRW